MNIPASLIIKIMNVNNSCECEIGDELKISSERVRQIKDRALQRLRHVTRSQLLKIYIH